MDLSDQFSPSESLATFEFAQAHEADRIVVDLQARLVTFTFEIVLTDHAQFLHSVAESPGPQYTRQSVGVELRAVTQEVYPRLQGVGQLLCAARELGQLHQMHL